MMSTIDGLIDIYVCKVAMNDNNPDDHNLLYINQGGNTFKEMSNAYGLDFMGFSTHYFANTDGLLVFNGNQWQKYVLPDHNIIRAVYCHRDRVYTGAYGAFGYWVRDACGHHSYTSLAHLVPNKLLDKEEVWHITSDGKDVYFQSFSVLLRYDGQAIHHVKLPGSIMFIQFVNGNKIIQCIDSGLYEIIDDNNHRKIAHTDFFIGKTVTAILPQVQDTASWLITTASDGVFMMKNGVIKPWNTRFQNHFICISDQ